MERKAGQTAFRTRANGPMTAPEKAKCSGQTKCGTKASFFSECAMESVKKRGKMVVFTLATGS